MGNEIRIKSGFDEDNFELAIIFGDYSSKKNYVEDISYNIESTMSYKCRSDYERCLVDVLNRAKGGDKDKSADLAVNIEPEEFASFFSRLLLVSSAAGYELRQRDEQIAALKKEIIFRKKESDAYKKLFDEAITKGVNQ